MKSSGNIRKQTQKEAVAKRGSNFLGSEGGKLLNMNIIHKKAELLKGFQSFFICVFLSFCEFHGFSGFYVAFNELFHRFFVISKLLLAFICHFLSSRSPTTTKKASNFNTYFPNTCLK
jgi:hypothetical protein